MNFETYIANNGLLFKAFNWLLNNNKGCNNPYHNNRHIISVARRCYYLACENNITYDYKNVLIIAALFHDINHVGNKSIPDSKNIENALNELRLFFTAYPTLFEYDYYPQIELLIKSTEFPHTEIETSEPLLLSLINIIRDADMSQLLLEDWVEMCVFGLAKEWVVSIKEQIENQYKFFSHLKYNSILLQSEFESKLPEYIKTLDLMKNRV